MIIEVHKYLFFGAKDDLDAFFNRAQELGFIEFIPASLRTLGEAADHLSSMIKAIKVLKKEPRVKQVNFVKDRTSEEVVDRILHVRKELDRLHDEEKMLKGDIARIVPFGDFDIDEIRELERESGYHFQFLAVKHRAPIPDPSMLFVKTLYDMDYYLSISDQLVTNHKMIELHFDRSLSELKTALRMVHVQLNALHIEIKELAQYLDFLEEHYIDELNAHNLHCAKKEVATQMGKDFFSVEGWVSTDRLSELKQLTDELAIFYDRIRVESKDRVPTAMSNERWGAVGEDLVHIYDTPATSDRDPSRYVLFAFALFFAMIVADAGYGIIYLTISIICYIKFKQRSRSLFRFLKLAILLSSCCLVWGVLTASYFGVDMAPDNPLKKVSITHYLAVARADYMIAEKNESYREYVASFPALQNETTGQAWMEKGIDKEGVYVVMDRLYDNVLIEIALIIGILHIILSLCRYLDRNLSGIGWIICMIGAYLYFPSQLEASSLVNVLGLLSLPAATEAGFQLFVGGGVLACVVALIQHRWRGLEEVTKIVQIFADTLSYLRLYALGLAGMMLASTFNHMDQIVGSAAGIVVMLIGHMINIVLGIMGGVIHGLRLNFLEWYHYSFEGGGRRFQPLIQIMKE